MDFVAKEIFYLFWFSAMLGTIGGTVTGPINQAVPEGTKDVTIMCTSNVKSGNLIKWTFTPVGSIPYPKPIKDPGSSIKDTQTYDGREESDSKSYTLIIRNATASTAGTYTCDDTNGKYSALLVVLEQTCDFSPRPTNTRPCDSILTLSCAVTYLAESTYVTASLTWSREGLNSPVLSSSTSGIYPKRTSEMNVTWPTEGEMPIYTCDIAFTLSKGATPGEMAVAPPASIHVCKPFDSANSVLCGQKEDPSGKGDPNSTDDPEKSGQNNFSARSAETNNLAIRVLGVAGVLLLAQVL